MMFNRNNDSDGVFRSENHLTMRHVPDEPVGRRYEIERMAEALMPIAHRRKPSNLLIHGPTGTGKSLCVTHVLDRLEDETRVKSVRVNCWKYNTRPSFLTQLLILLEFPAPRKGKPVDELLSRLREWLNKNSSVVIALEEFDQLREQTEIVYDLHHVSEESDNDIGLLLVSNTHPSDIELDPRSKSRLSVQTLEFQPYRSEQLFNILKTRASQAFHPETVPSDVLAHVADIVAKSSGDCRRALEILLRAGRLAELQKAEQIDRSHVEAVV